MLVLTRRAKRWFEPLGEEVERLLLYLKTSPATELSVAVLRTWLYAWCTSSRFNRPIEPCRLCRLPEGDRQSHYLVCDVVRRWMSDRLRLADLPPEPVAGRIFLRAAIAGREGSLKVAVALDAIIFAVDSIRHGAMTHPTSVLDARLKEMRRRCPAVRRISLGMLRFGRLTSLIAMVVTSLFEA